jgi:hypothetical protein
MTGRFYENEMPIQDFFKNAFLGNSVPAILRKGNYQVDLIGGGKNLYADATIASNRLEIKEIINQEWKFKEIAFIYDIAFFRHFPHFGKRLMYNNQAWRLVNLRLDRSSGGFPAGMHREGIRFMEQMTRNAKSDSEKNTFKYVHLLVSHVPLRVNESLEYEEMELVRENFKRQAKGSLKLVSMLLEKLKEIDAYDQTMILVLADHGIGRQVEAEADKLEVSRGYVSPMTKDIMGRAHVLVLRKPFMSRQELTVSDAPIALSDIGKTILSELKLQDEIPGMSAFDVSDSAIRDRRVFYAERGKHGRQFHKNFMPPMHEYIVSGPGWKNESWRRTYRTFTSGGIKDVSPEQYEYGTKITFGESGNYLQYKGVGWSYPEKGYTRTIGKLASLGIPARKTDAGIELKASLWPFIMPDKVEKQRIAIFINGAKAGEWILTESRLQTQTLRIPAGSAKNGSMDIAFELPDADSPANLDAGKDERELAIRVDSIVLDEI